MRKRWSVDKYGKLKGWRKGEKKRQKIRKRREYAKGEFEELGKLKRENWNGRGPETEERQGRNRRAARRKLYIKNR